MIQNYIKEIEELRYERRPDFSLSQITGTCLQQQYNFTLKCAASV